MPESNAIFIWMDRNCMSSSHGLAARPRFKAGISSGGDVGRRWERDARASPEVHARPYGRPVHRPWFKAYADQSPERRRGDSGEAAIPRDAGRSTAVKVRPMAGAKRRMSAPRAAHVQQDLLHRLTTRNPFLPVMSEVSKAAVICGIRV
ncbi:hypothetical protein ASG25_02260 [Rhizobium sp. Leaf384]|nr:hypothetical protein ASG25_02260 [Rhizobium sp. Leaf384]KQS86504.1 hypothetical protein ASG58_17330 [Rhizobium sp. Leaf383]